MVPARRGRIVNITNQCRRVSLADHPRHSVSKAAMIKLTENLAIEASRAQDQHLQHPPRSASHRACRDRPQLGCPTRNPLCAWAQREPNAGHGAEPDRAIGQVYRLTTGRYDERYGRHLSVHDDLDEILRDIHDVRDSELYLLGMHRLAV